MNRYLLIVLLLVSSTALAKVKLPSILSEQMVLQQKSDVLLWGESSNSEVTIKTSWNDALYRVKVEANATFQVSVSTPPAGGPYYIEFDDGELLRLNEVFIGEVWICSGQSNMDMKLKGFRDQPVEGALETILDSPHYPIHIHTVKHLLEREVGEDYESTPWQRCTPEVTAESSATAYYFARTLQRTLQVPIGIVVSSWGGTSILSWMSEKALTEIPSDVVTSCVARNSRPQNQPSALFNSMLTPLLNYQARGFIWYQGEHNLAEYKHYAAMMKSLAQEFRNHWKDVENEMPFYYVQIAPWRYYNNSHGVERPLLVEAQVKALELIPNSGMATTTDVGDELCIHPAQKKEVGERLALTALLHTYKCGITVDDVFAPKEVLYQDSVAYLSVPQVKLGFHPSTPLGFELAGADKKFYPAQATIEKDRIKVVAPEVEKPIALRYAFRNYVEATLKNHLGIPFPSFRTDDWE